ncbi:MAG TPA: tetratricopeptide repeat protein, partial [Geobacteraceae bacterium]
PAAVWRQVLAEKLPLLVPVIAVAVVTLQVQGRGGALNASDAGALYSNMANAAVSLVVYLRQFFVPVGLAVFYPFTFWAFWKWGGAVLLLAAVSFVVLRQQHRPYLAFGWLWYLVTMLPVIGLIRVGSHAHADRYTYVPLIGVTVLTVWLVADLAGPQLWGRRAAGIAAVASIGACALLSYRQVSYWHDSFTLFNRAVTVTSNNWLAHNNLSLIYFQWGQFAESERHIMEAIRIRPNYEDAVANLGVLRKAQGRTQEAAAAFRRAVELNPRSINPTYQLGICLISQGDLAGSEEMHRRLVSLDPVYAAALNDMIVFARSRQH